VKIPDGINYFMKQFHICIMNIIKSMAPSLSAVSVWKKEYFHEFLMVLEDGKQMA
jgi:hypothetical protein